MGRYGEVWGGVGRYGGDVARQGSIRPHAWRRCSTHSLKVRASAPSWWGFGLVFGLRFGLGLGLGLGFGLGLGLRVRVRVGVGFGGYARAHLQ